MNKQHLLIVLSCLCLGLVTFGFSQDTSDTAETTTQVETTTNETENTANATDVTSETSTETSTETDAQTETTEADITESNVTEADATETGTTEISTTKEEQVATENETTASNNNEETTNSGEVASTSDTEDTESGTVSDTESNADDTDADDPDADDPEKTTEVNNTNNTTNNAEERIVTIEYSGGNRKSVDLRYGPWIYSHPNAEGIIGTVGSEGNSQLTVYAQEAELKAPEDVLIATAGERVASFTGGVRVERKRLTALGESLEYSEETGFGELLAQERINITVRPKETDGDTTEIQAASATFDVDTDVSVSRGGVTLQSGSQSGEAEEITFEQGLDLAVMISPNGQVTLQRSGEDSNLTITADTVRVLTETKKLMASGNVKLVDGAITTTGETVFFDDEIERAEVFGSPDNLAVSTDSEFDVTIKGQRLEQSIDDDLVEILDETAPNIWNEADFLLTSEIQ